MKKRFFLFLFSLALSNMLFGQEAVVLDPQFPALTEEVTITFDVTLAEDSRAEGLLGLTDDVFLWSGAGAAPGSGPAFEFGPEGQDDFGSPYEPGRMTFLGDDKWSITIVIKDYFNIPDEDENRITTLGMLLKNADGSAQTEDFFVSIVDDSQVENAFTITPENPTVNDEITIQIDLTKALDTRAEGLLGATDEVYLWSGIGNESNPFENGPPGQDNFGVPYPPGEMTPVGDDVWEISLVPAEYYNITSNVNELTRIGFLAKNADGSAQTEDFIGDIEPGGFLVNLVSPSSSGLQFIEEDAAFPISVSASTVGDLQIEIDSGAGFEVVASIESRNFLSFNYPAKDGESISIRVTGSSGDIVLTKTAEVEFFVKSERVESPLPTGIVPGINYDPADDTKVTLALVAPQKDYVYFVGDQTNWQIRDEYQMNYDPSKETYWIELNELTPNQPYVFGYLTNHDDASGSNVLVGDPYADLVIDPNNDAFIDESVYPNIPESSLEVLPDNKVTGGNVLLTAFETGQEPYMWGPVEDSWERPEEKDLVIYELLVRDFTGSYKTMIDSLDYIKGIGVNAIELMPIMEFGGNSNWGYQPDYYMAPDKAYGTKNDLKAFIEACHEKGLAVILDVVFNQADKNPYVFMYFDFQSGRPRSDSPFFNESAIPDCLDFFRDWNHESTYTRALIDTTLQYWIREYHVDGFRFDISNGFTQNNNCGGFDESRVDIVTHYYDVIKAVDPDAYVTLEHFSSDELGTLQELGAFTWAFVAKFRYQEIMKADPPTANINEAAEPGVVAAMENHDEQRLVFEAREFGTSAGDYNIQDLEVALERAKMAPAFFFTLPGPKLMWMFGELGYDIDINFNGRTGEKPLPWGDDPDALGYYEDPERQKVYSVYSAVLNLTHEHSDVFDDGETDISQLNQEVKRISITHPDMDVMILGNWATSGLSIDPEFTKDGTWYDFFTGDSINVLNVNDAYTFAPGEFHIFTTERLEVPESDLVPWTVEFQEVTGLDDKLGEDLKLYPNPAKDKVTIAFDRKDAISFEMYDISGKNRFNVPYKIFDQKFEINTSSLQPGIYIFKIRVGNRSVDRKVIINN